MTDFDDLPSFHNDYQIRWKNYKTFKDTDWITLKPLTIIIGANNSGKTSITSPLLALNQTINSEDRHTALVGSGKLVDIGSFKDFVHLHKVKDEVFFGLRYHIHTPMKRLKSIKKTAPGAIEVSFSYDSKSKHINLSKFDMFDIYLRKYMERSLQENGSYSLGGEFDIDKMQPVERTAIANAKPFNFMFSLENTFDALIADESEQLDVDRFSKEFHGYLSTINHSNRWVRSFLKNLNYIGPVREKFNRTYRISGEVPKTVGSKGENTANLFRCNVDILQDNVNHWVREFEFGDKIEIETLNNDFFQLVFKRKGHKTNISDAGFGASQILPLIIQAFALDEESLTIAEQPEIHLNPKLQSKLADLFLEMVKKKHRIVVETHSEHLLLRIRTLIAKKEISPDYIALYFVEQNRKGSIIKRIPIDDTGHISFENWPKGFFADALEQSFALAQAQMKVV